MKKSRYIGSVKFYKNLILLVVVLAIGTGTFFSIFYRSRYRSLKAESSAISTSFSVDSDAISYQEKFPDFYAPQEYCATSRESGVLYLTFDGGSDSCTEEILRILEENDVTATFFVTGNTSKDTLKEISSKGHAVGMLSYSLDYLTIYASVESYLQDMSQLYDYILEVTGEAPTLFRFLGGSINSYNSGFYQELLAEMIRRGFVPFDWNLSIKDTTTSSVESEEMVAQLTSDITAVDRGIILLHNDSDNQEMLDALPDMILQMKEQNFKLAPLTYKTKPILFAYPN